MNVLLFVSLGLFGLFATALVTPVRVRAWGVAGEVETWGRAEARWGPFAVQVGTDRAARGYVGGIGFRLPASSGRAQREREKKKTQRKWLSMPTGSAVGRDARVVATMLRQALRALGLRLELAGTLGLDDPADTATTLAVGQLIHDALPGGLRLELRDDLLEDTTQLGGSLSARAIPAQLALLLLTWLVRADTRRVLRGARRR